MRDIDTHLSWKGKAIRSVLSYIDGFASGSWLETWANNDVCLYGCKIEELE